MDRILIILLTIGVAASFTVADQNSYYKEWQQFHFTPDPKAPRNEIGRLGPIGLGLELRQPAFTMHIKSVEEGSPAASTGKLKPGQIIESINGEAAIPTSGTTRALTRPALSEARSRILTARL